MKILQRAFSWTLERVVAPALGLHETQLSPPSSVHKKVYFYIFPVCYNEKIKGTLFAPVTKDASNYSNILRKLITKDYGEEDLEIDSGHIKCFNDNSGIEYLLVPKNKCITNNTYKNNSVFILIANSSEDLNILDKYITDINIKDINFCLVLITHLTQQLSITAVH